MAGEADFYTLPSEGRERIRIAAERFDALVAEARDLESRISILAEAEGPLLSEATPGVEIHVEDLEQVLSNTKRIHKLGGLLLREQAAILIHLFGRTTQQVATMLGVPRETVSTWSQDFFAEHERDFI